MIVPEPCLIMPARENELCPADPWPLANAVLDCGIGSELGVRFGDPVPLPSRKEGTVCFLRVPEAAIAEAERQALTKPASCTTQLAFQTRLPPACGM